MSYLLIVLDATLLGLLGYYLFWQNRMDVPAAYSFFQILFAVIMASWFLTTGIADITYIIFIATFLTMAILGGSSGLADKRLIAMGMFQRVIPYSKLTAVTLTPITLPNGQSVVMAMFQLSKRRLVRMTFKADLDAIMQRLKPRVPEHLTIEVQKVG